MLFPSLKFFGSREAAERSTRKFNSTSSAQFFALRAWRITVTRNFAIGNDSRESEGLSSTNWNHSKKTRKGIQQVLSFSLESLSNSSKIASKRSNFCIFSVLSPIIEQTALFPRRSTRASSANALANFLFWRMLVCYL